MRSMFTMFEDVEVEEEVVNSKSKSYTDDSLIKEKSFAFTGTLDNYTRKDIIFMLENKGAHVDKSVTYDTNYLVIPNGKLNDKSFRHGTKMSEAVRKNVTIIEEDVFLSMLSKYDEENIPF